MNSILTTIIGRMKDWLLVFQHAWRDARVPILARFFLFVAPLYWLNPFDILPDLQPGGYYDDAVVFCLLVWSAYKLVPKEVFLDARSAVSPAVCGVMCISLFGIAAFSGGLSTARDHAGQLTKLTQPAVANQFALVKRADGETSVVCQPQAGASTDDAPGEVMRSRFGSATPAALDHSRGAPSPSPSPSPSPAALSSSWLDFAIIPLAPAYISTMAKSSYCAGNYLLLRGGQCQLYAADGRVRHCHTVATACQFSLPLLTSGGIFIACFGSLSTTAGAEVPC